MVVYTVYADRDSGMRMMRNDDHDDAHELGWRSRAEQRNRYTVAA